MDLNRIEETLCKSMCGEVRLHPRSDGRLLVETPFTLPDGDGYTIFIEERGSGVRITDCGHTMMHLSYSEDLKRLESGTRAELFEAVIAQAGLEYADGEIRLDSPVEELGKGLFLFSQGITRLHDLDFLRRARVERTFYDDLKTVLEGLVPVANIVPDFAPINDPLYRVDFSITGKASPLFVYGVHDGSKAKLVTIALRKFQVEKVAFDSLIVCENEPSLPRGDLARLTDVSDEMVSSLKSKDDLARKVLKRAA